MDKTDMRKQDGTAAGTESEGEPICPAAQLETSGFAILSHTEPDGREPYGETRPFLLLSPFLCQ